MLGSLVAIELADVCLLYDFSLALRSLPRPGLAPHRLVLNTDVHAAAI
jgi:hypothetical protein